MSAVKAKIVIWGASGHAKVVLDILRLDHSIEVVGFLDSVNPVSNGQTFCGLPVLGGVDVLSALQANGVCKVAAGFGDCHGRLRMMSELESRGLELQSAIHPSAVIAGSAQLASGVVVCANAVVNPDAQIGRGTIINTAASIDHDCRIGDAVHIAPGVRLGGGVEIGSASLIGIGTTVRDHITVGSRTIVGAGSLVMKSLPSNIVAYGHPAQVMRSSDEIQT